MQLLDLTLPTPQENLALDEALLDEADEAEGPPREYLRLWESDRPFVVLGRSSRVEQEVDLDACGRLGVPVLRRSSGGAAVVAGPGCLMYAVVLSYDRAADLRMIDRAHRFVLDRMADGLRGLLPGIARQGTSDLTTGGRKFSGNSLRCKRRYFLYHGSLLYGLDAELIARCLRMPPRQPDYRQGRGHRAFLTNVSLDAAALRAAVIEAWDITGPVTSWPVERVAMLVRERYSCSDWTFRFG